MAHEQPRATRVTRQKGEMPEMIAQAILVEPARRHAPYPDAPQRDDMQNSIYLCERGTTATLKEHFGNPDSTMVRNEARLGPSPRSGAGAMR